MTAPCELCGSDVTDPKGTILHRFVFAEKVVSLAGMKGTVVLVPARDVGRIGLTVVWENGHRGRVAPANLVHAA